MGATVAGKVFISYSHNDGEAAESLAQELEARGFAVLADQAVVDDWTKNRSSDSVTFNRRLDQELASCDAFVVFADRNPSRWQEQELSAALRRKWESPDMRIVPVVGPGERISGALASYQAIKMANEPDKPHWQEQVLSALDTEDAAPVEVNPKMWPGDTRIEYQRRLSEIEEIAKVDEERWLDTEPDSWSRDQ